MSNKVYGHARRAFLRGEINVLADTFGALLVVSDLSEETYEFLDDVGGGVRASTAAVSTVGLEADEPWVTGDDIAFSGVGGTEHVIGLVLYRDSGSEATSRLVAWIDKRADTVPVDIVPTGAGVLARFPGRRLFHL